MNDLAITHEPDQGALNFRIADDMDIMHARRNGHIHGSSHFLSGDDYAVDEDGVSVAAMRPEGGIFLRQQSGPTDAP